MKKQQLKWSRNPFIFLGHFNIPTTNNWQWIPLTSRNPFIFLGHFNPTYRNFPINGKTCRNPFIFLGHFNIYMREGR